MVPVNARQRLAVLGMVGLLGLGGAVAAVALRPAPTTTATLPAATPPATMEAVRRATSLAAANVGITNRGQLIDGGIVNVPESGYASKTGEWIIEGHGVEPDIEVDNDPQSVIAGKDPQLERGIAEVMAKLKQPVKLPGKPAPPVKTINNRQTSKN